MVAWKRVIDGGYVEKAIIFGEVFSKPWRGIVLTARGYKSFQFKLSP